MSQLSPAEPAMPATVPPPNSPLPGAKAPASKPPPPDDLAGSALTLRNWRVEGQFAPGALAALTAAQAHQASNLASFGTSATLGESQVCPRCGTRCRCVL